MDKSGHTVIHDQETCVIVVLNLFLSSFLFQLWSIKTFVLVFSMMTEKTEHCRHPSEPDGKKHFRLFGEDLCADHSQKVIIY